MKQANVTDQQIQVVWIKQAEAGPSQYGDFPKHAMVLKDNLVKCLNLFGSKIGCLPDPLTVGFSAFNTSRYFLDYNRNSTGADATLGYQ